MTRDEMIALIRAEPDSEFQGEVEHYMGIEDREYAYDEVSALFDIEAAAEEAKDKRLLKVASRVLIAIGFYRPMGAEEIANTYTSRRHPWNFKLAGVAYTSDEMMDDWRFPEESAA